MIDSATGFGECQVRRQHDFMRNVHELYIVRADPQILILVDIIDQAIHRPNDVLWIDFSNQLICNDDHEQHDSCACYKLRTILHIKGVNREVLYRITPHPLRSDVYVGRWPD